MEQDLQASLAVTLVSLFVVFGMVGLSVAAAWVTGVIQWHGDDRVPPLDDPFFELLGVRSRAAVVCRNCHELVPYDRHPEGRDDALALHAYACVALASKIS